VTGARILIIEDHGPSRDVAAYLLRASGHCVSLAEGGRAGVELAREQCPDLVICDLQMPEFNGYEVLAHLSAHAGAARPTIVAVTASSTAEDRERTIAAGFDGYLTKPIAPESFVAQIERFLPVELRTAGPRPRGT